MDTTEPSPKQPQKENKNPHNILKPLEKTWTSRFYKDKKKKLTELYG